MGTCTVHDSGITDINCNVANPAISGGDNVGDCLTNNGVHLTCVIPPQPGVFPCTRQWTTTWEPYDIVKSRTESGNHLTQSDSQTSGQSARIYATLEWRWRDAWGVLQQDKSWQKKAQDTWRYKEKKWRYKANVNMIKILENIGMQVFYNNFTKNEFE